MTLHNRLKYGERLSQLNDSFPLSIVKEGKQIISLPVADRIGSGVNEVANGKFLRTSAVGALNGINHTIYDNADWNALSWTSFDNSVQWIELVPGITFVMVQVKALEPGEKIILCTPSGVTIQEFGPVGDYPINIKADRLYFTKSGMDSAYAYFWAVW